RLEVGAGEPGEGVPEHGAVGARRLDRAGTDSREQHDRDDDETAHGHLLRSVAKADRERFNAYTVKTRSRQYVLIGIIADLIPRAARSASLRAGERVRNRRPVRIGPGDRLAAAVD